MKNKHITYIPILIILLLAWLLPLHAAEWNVEGEMLSPVYDGAAVVYNSQIYILGGYSAFTGLPTDTIQVYDPKTRTWQYGGKMNIPRASFVADVFDNNIVIIGGVSVDTLETEYVDSWNISTRSTEIIGINDSTDRINAVGGIYDNSFYIFGGYNSLIENGYVVPFIMEYSLVNNNAKNFTDYYSSISDQLPYQQMGVLYNKDFYLFGGIFFVPTNKVYKFNIDSAKFEQVYPSLEEAVAGGAAVADGSGRIYLIGGFNESSEALKTMYVYVVDMYGYSGYLGYDMNYARKECMAVNYNDSTLYVFGGLDEHGEIVTEFESFSLHAETTNVKNDFAAPSRFNLYANYPNPFNAGTRIEFDLAVTENVTLSIFDVNGRLVKVLAQGQMDPGRYQFQWDGVDQDNAPVSSNIYFYQLITDSGSKTRKMVLVK